MIDGERTTGQVVLRSRTGAYRFLKPDVSVLKAVQSKGVA